MKFYTSHTCEWGYDHNIVEYPLFEGTSNAIGGHAAELLFEQALKEGIYA